MIGLGNATLLLATWNWAVLAFTRNVGAMSALLLELLAASLPLDGLKADAFFPFNGFNARSPGRATCPSTPGFAGA